MANKHKKRRNRLVDPIDRISEILFGLIMVLTITGTLSVVTGGRAEVKTMILGALGCNLAWGIIDAGLYLMGCLGERGRNLLKLGTVRQTNDPDAGTRALVDALPAPLVSVLSRDELEFDAAATDQASPIAAAHTPDKGRMVGRFGNLSAGVLFYHPSHHSVPVHGRCAVGAPSFQRRCDHHVVHVRLCVRAGNRTSLVANRPSNGRRRRSPSGNRNRARRMSAPGILKMYGSLRLDAFLPVF